MEISCGSAHDLILALAHSRKDGSVMAVSTLRAGLCLALLLVSVPVAGAQTAPAPASARLDFDSFRREIEPIFLKARPGQVIDDWRLMIG
jgi:hypothetical protein